MRQLLALSVLLTWVACSNGSDNENGGPATTTAAQTTTTADSENDKPPANPWDSASFDSEHDDHRENNSFLLLKLDARDPKAVRTLHSSLTPAFDPESKTYSLDGAAAGLLSVRTDEARVTQQCRTTDAPCSVTVDARKPALMRGTLIGDGITIWKHATPASPAEAAAGPFLAILSDEPLRYPGSTLEIAVGGLPENEPVFLKWESANGQFRGQLGLGDDGFAGLLQISLSGFYVNGPLSFTLADQNGQPYGHALSSDRLRIWYQEPSE